MTKAGKENANYSGFQLILGSCILALTCLVLVAYIWQQPEMLALLLCLNAAVLIWMGKPAHDSLLFLFAAMFGSASEAFAINFGGAWAYPQPYLFGLPYWLPFVWGTAGLFLVRAYFFIGELLGKKSG